MTPGFSKQVGYYEEDDDGNMKWHKPEECTPPNNVSYVRTPAPTILGTSGPGRPKKPKNSVVKRLFDPASHTVYTPPCSALPRNYYIRASLKLQDLRSGQYINGLFTAEDRKKNTILGQYFGKMISDDEAKTTDSNYMFEVRVRGKVAFVLDAADERHGSFLRFVNAANNEKDINAVFYQYDKKIFLRTTRNIKAHEEILTTYGKDTNAIINNVPVYR